MLQEHICPQINIEQTAHLARSFGGDLTKKMNRWPKALLKEKRKCCPCYRQNKTAPTTNINHKMHHMFVMGSKINEDALRWRLSRCESHLCIGVEHYPGKCSSQVLSFRISPSHAAAMSALKPAIAEEHSPARSPVPPVGRPTASGSGFRERPERSAAALPPGTSRAARAAAERVRQLPCQRRRNGRVASAADVARRRLAAADAAPADAELGRIERRPRAERPARTGRQSGRSARWLSHPPEPASG